MRIYILIFLACALFGQESEIPREKMAARVVDVLAEYEIEIEGGNYSAYISPSDRFTYPDGFSPAGGTVIRIYGEEQVIGWIEALNIPSERGTVWGFRVHGGPSEERGRRVIRFNPETAAIQWSINADAQLGDPEGRPDGRP